MHIIRQIMSKFAVPDMRNVGTQVRLIVISILYGLFLPLISDSDLSYWTQVYRTASWGAPTLLLIMLTGYVFSQYATKLDKIYGVI